MEQVETIDQYTKLVKIDEDHSKNQYPVFLRNVREDNPDWSFNEKPDLELVNSLGYAVVHETTRPEGQFVQEGIPVFQNGTWLQTWVTRDFSPEEEAAELARLKQAMLSNITILLSSSLEKGFLFDFGTGSGHVQLRTIDRTNISGAGMKADRLIAQGVETAVCVFRTYENQTFRCTPQVMHDLSDQAYDAYLEFMTIGWTLKDAVDSATQISELPTLPESFELAPK